MLDRKNIEQVLSVNGLDSEATDDEIKSLLVSARWHEDDIETALVVLRENPETHKQTVDSVHRTFAAGDRMSADTLNAILGIDVEVSKVSAEHHKELERAYRSQVISLVFVSIVLGTLFIMAVMWTTKMGLFYGI
ncbi:hypothetical protein N9L26_00150 [Candidatus Pacebacteria bacterium]|nr:hypothetical protein [Candidatus Paceibacterota bacterium]